MATRGVSIEREYNVVKSNEMIQKSRYSLSLQEQKVLLRIIQMIRPEDTDFKQYEFKLRDFCSISGTEVNGKNYEEIKGALLKLRKHAWYLKKPNGALVTVGWIQKAEINPNIGTVTVELDRDLKPYLLQLQDFFTTYSLYYTIAMRSKYSIRLYEIFKSYENLGVKAFDIQELQAQLMAETYSRWQDFRRYVIEAATKEINMLSDLSVSYELNKTGRQYTEIVFKIRLKTDANERMEAWAAIEHRLDKTQVKGQLNMAMRNVMQAEGVDADA